jgi:hypothetical protein
MKPSTAHYRLAKAAIQLAHFRVLNTFCELQNDNTMDAIIADACTLYYKRLEAVNPEDMAIVASLVGQMYSKDLENEMYRTEAFLAKGARGSYFDELQGELHLLGFSLDTQREFIYSSPKCV